MKNKKHLVVLVHGIRTFAYWMSDITPVLEKSGFVVASTSYGRFNLLRFLFPGSFLKKEAIERIRREIADAIALHNPEQVSIIAHSFGTYVVSQIMASEPETRWDRVIFCGSVLPENFSFAQYSARFKSPLLNEIGTRDFFPALAESVTWGYGFIGTHGINSPYVRNHSNKGRSHSDFLEPDFVETFWIPFLLKGEIAVSAEAKPWILSRIITAIPMRWILLLCLALLTMFWLYIWISHVEPEANIRACESYRASTALTWRAENLRIDRSKVTRQ